MEDKQVRQRKRGAVTENRVENTILRKVQKRTFSEASRLNNSNKSFGLSSNSAFDISFSVETP